MTDDEKLAGLFRDAASGEAPPSGFDHADVTAASRRITVRRRTALVGGAVALVAVVGIGSVVTLPRGSSSDTTAAAPAAGAERAAPPMMAQAPLGPGNTACADRQDPALRALVDQVLPEVAGATEAATTDICLPGGQRGVSLEVTDGGASGLLGVTYLPPGTVVALPTGNYRSAPTASGGTVIVGSNAVGAGGAAPFGSRLPAVLAYLAPRL